MPRLQKSTNTNTGNQTLAERLQAELQLKQSYLNLFLGFLIVLVIGVLVFNYFKKTPGTLGPATQTTTEQSTNTTAQPDVNPENLPGKYTVKEGDTLFLIAQHYYNDGLQFTQIATANKMDNPDVLQVGQVLDIPKIEANTATKLDQPAPAANSTTDSVSAPTVTSTSDQGTGGAINQTQWGEKIEGNTYTVVAGDWLSTIAGRAYGDIYAFDKIAKANNISNPDLIEPGMMLKIPR